MSKKRKKEKRDRGTYPGPTFADDITSLLVSLLLAALVVGAVALAWQRFSADRPVSTPSSTASRESSTGSPRQAGDPGTPGPDAARRGTPQESAPPAGHPSPAPDPCPNPQSHHPPRPRRHRTHPRHQDHRP